MAGALEETLTRPPRDPLVCFRRAPQRCRRFTRFLTHAEIPTSFIVSTRDARRVPAARRRNEALCDRSREGLRCVAMPRDPPCPEGHVVSRGTAWRRSESDSPFGSRSRVNRIARSPTSVPSSCSLASLASTFGGLDRTSREACLEKASDLAWVRSRRRPRSPFDRCLLTHDAVSKERAPHSSRHTPAHSHATSRVRFHAGPRASVSLPRNTERFFPAMRLRRPSDAPSLEDGRNTRRRIDSRAYRVTGPRQNHPIAGVRPSASARRPPLSFEKRQPRGEPGQPRSPVFPHRVNDEGTENPEHLHIAPPCIPRRTSRRGASRPAEAGPARGEPMLCSVTDPGARSIVPRSPRVPSVAAHATHRAPARTDSPCSHSDADAAVILRCIG